METTNTLISSQFGFEMTATTDSGKTWYLVADVCKCLGHSNPSQFLKDHSFKIPDGAIKRLRNKRGVLANFVSEEGLYPLIMESTKPKAEKFRVWVYTEVLPSINHTGVYIPPILLRPENHETLVNIIKHLEQQNNAKEQTINTLKATNMEIKRENTSLLKSKLELSKTITGLEETLTKEISKSAYLSELAKEATTQAIGQISRPLGIPPYQANLFLQEQGIIEKYASGWSLTEEYKDMGINALGKKGLWYVRFNLEGAALVRYMLKTEYLQEEGE